MSTNKKDITDKVEKAADHVVHPEHETKKEARKRQPWMPIAGSIIAAVILISIFFLYMRG